MTVQPGDQETLSGCGGTSIALRLESGCSVEGGRRDVPSPLLNARIEYQHACAAEWTKSFRVSRNRIDAWKTSERCHDRDPPHLVSD
jgi:hypothetical protein